MDAVHNKAVIGLSIRGAPGIGGAPGFQFLDLGTSPSFEAAFASSARASSEGFLIDPSRNLLLSPSEGGIFEIVDVTNASRPAFFENNSGLRRLDSAGEDCSTGIALAPQENSSPGSVFIADLTQATKTPGSPGTWTAPSQKQTLPESFPQGGTSSVAVAQGTHTGVMAGEFGRDSGKLTAIALPATSGSGTPKISDWVTCAIGNGFKGGGFDPHSVTAYQSPNGAKDAIALIESGDVTQLAKIDLTQMLNPTIVPPGAGGHACAARTLPAALVSIIGVPPQGVPFAAFSAQLEIDKNSFELNASFTLPRASNGINPLTEPVTLKVGPFTTTIPPGSFKKIAGGAFRFEGVIKGVSLEALIKPTGALRYAFQAEATGANMAGTKNPVAVSLTIGDDSGTTSVKAEIDD